MRTISGANYFKFFMNIILQDCRPYNVMFDKDCKKCKFYDSSTVGHPDNRVFYCWKMKNYKAKKKSIPIAKHCQFYSRCNHKN